MIPIQTRWWSRLFELLAPYLISPIGKPAKLRTITYFAANRPKKLINANRYPRQIIGVGIRLPDMKVRFRAHPAPEQTCHPVLSIVWSTPHGAGRWKSSRR